MIPSFDVTGLLPVGIHWASLKEFEVRFGINDHRQRLIGGLQRGVLALMAAGCRIVYVNGSFVTAKEFPKDYDACWDAAGVRIRDLDPVLLDFSNRRAAQKAKFGGEFFPSHLAAELKSPFRAFIDFFQEDTNLGLKKGIIGLNFSKPI